MDDDFFSDSVPAQPAPQQPPHDEDQFQEAQYQSPSLPDYGTAQQQFGSYTALENAPVLDAETTNKIRQEQDEIQRKLRQKSNAEYEDKQRRRQQGQTQLTQFLQKKQQQTINRKKQNREKQQNATNNTSTEASLEGWKKVAANVALKQGEHKGAKDITRMRESIINKKSDER